MNSKTSFKTAVEIWNNDLPETPIQPVNFPQFRPLTASRVPPTEEVARFLETNSDPRSLWANQEHSYMSKDLQKTNETDLKQLAESILSESISSLSVSASSSRQSQSKDEPDMKLSRRFVPSAEINRRVQLSNAFWLSHRDVSAVTVSANEALQGGGGQDKVLHFLAGPSLKAETATFPDDGQKYYDGFRVRCPTGQVRISHGHNLHQPFVIHLVGPYLDEEDQVAFDTSFVHAIEKQVQGTLSCRSKPLSTSRHFAMCWRASTATEFGPSRWPCSARDTTAARICWPRS
jgi:hypothetical protein